MNSNVFCAKFVSDFYLTCLKKFSKRKESGLAWVAGMRRMAGGLSIAIGLCSGPNASAIGTPLTLTVTSVADSFGSCSGTGSSLNCPTLRSAIVQADTDSGSTIQFQSGLTGTIYLTSTLPTISQSATITGPGANTLTISGNSSYQILTISSGTVTISALTFANGNAHGADAGAILNSGTLTLANTTFSGNYGDYGGAVTSYGALTVTNCTFSGNTAVNGGGAINSNATLTVTNSTFSGNSTTDAIPSDGAFGGGAIASFAGNVTLTSDTFSGNSSAYTAGAVLFDSGFGATLTATNNVFIGNSVSSSFGGAGIVADGLIANVSYNLFYQNLNASGVESDCGCTSNTNAITGINPNLLPLGYYGGPTETMLPQPGSPAICAGNYADIPNGVTTDQRGFPLTNSACSNGGLDVGAVQSDYVQVTNTNDSGAGSLRAAITAAIATSGGDIDFAPAVSGTITLASALPTISQSMVILGPGAGNLTISGNNFYQIFNIGPSSTMFFSGLTLANGISFTGNLENGAVFNGGTLTVAESIFIGNSGGAIDNNGPLNVTNSTFSGNSSSGGSAISTSGTATVIDSDFSGNSGSLGGGAIGSNGTTTVINCTFSGNSASSASGDFGGGAIESFGGTATVINSTFSGNSTASRGGAIDSFSGATLMAFNNIFTGNSSSDGGAGIVDLGGTVNASYNLFYQNLNAGTTEDDCNGCTSNTNAITGSSPLLAAPGNYGGSSQTMLPEPGSPAICSGTSGLIPSGVIVDQRGFSRTTSYGGTACADLGAVQTDYTAVVFSASSYSDLVNQNVNPALVVTVTENGQNIGGVPITLGFSGTGSPTGLGPVTTMGGAGAIFSSLTASSPAQGTLSVNLPITAPGNAVQPAALTASASLNIHSTVQTITFAAPSTQTYGTAPITLAATGGDSGNPVTFSLDPTSTPGAATLSGSTLTITGVGMIVIDANQAAGSGYTAAAQVQQSVQVNAASLTITASSPTVTYGSAVPTITPIFGTFFNGDTSSVLTKQPTCVTAYTMASAAGSSPLTSCSGAAAANYTFTYLNGSVSVSKAPATVTVTPSSSSITTAQALTVTVAVGGGGSTPTGSVTLTNGSYSSGAVTLASGSATISIPAGSLAVGSDTLSATYTPDTAGSLNYNGATGTSSVSVVLPPTFVVGSSGSSSISIVPGATTGNTVPITITPSNGFTGTVTLTCSISPTAASDPATCSLSPNSVVITGTVAQTSTLTISTTASTVGENQLKKVLWPSAGTALALLLMIGVPRRRRGWRTMLGVLALSIALGSIGCGGDGGGNGGGGSGGGNSGTTPGTYTITVTGTSGNVTGTVGTITLTVP